MGIHNYYLENNINMRYNELFNIPLGIIIFVLVFLIIIISFCKLVLDIIITLDINNEDVIIKLNIKYINGLLNINKQIYPKSNKNIKEKKNKKGENKGKHKIHVLKKDLIVIYKLTDYLRLYEFYSSIEIGSTYMGFTAFMCVFVNIIYGNLSNLINPTKIYLRFRPNFTENFIKTHIKIHMKPTIKDLVYIGIRILKIFIKKSKEGEKNESHWFNTKSYGDNSGNY